MQTLPWRTIFVLTIRPQMGLWSSGRPPGDPAWSPGDQEGGDCESESALSWSGFAYTPYAPDARHWLPWGSRTLRSALRIDLSNVEHRHANVLTGQGHNASHVTLAEAQRARSAVAVAHRTLSHLVQRALKVGRRTGDHPE
jgi:hypothetical protein